MDSTTLPIITTPRLVLRWISEDDIDSLYAIFSDPQVMRYWSTVPLPNREAAAELQRETVATIEQLEEAPSVVSLLDKLTYASAPVPQPA